MPKASQFVAAFAAAVLLGASANSQAGATEASPAPATTPVPSPTPAILQQESSDVDQTSPVHGYTLQTLYSGPSYGPKDLSLWQVVPRVDELRIGESLLRITLPRYAWIPNGPYGFGDAVLAYLFTLPASSSERLGIGLTAVVPTASTTAFGLETWGLGPAVGWVKIDRYTASLAGFFLQSTFSVAGPEKSRNESALTIQPIYVKQLGSGWSLRSADAMWTFDFQRGSSLVPLSLGVGKLFPAGSHSVNVVLADSVTLIHANGPNLPKNTLKVVIRISDLWQAPR